MHAYLGVTCHFITRSWHLELVLLSCSHLRGRHTGVNILAEFEQAVEKFSILQQLFQVVMDNASNMLKAFPESVSLSGFDSLEPIFESFSAASSSGFHFLKPLSSQTVFPFSQWSC